MLKNINIAKNQLFFLALLMCGINFAFTLQLSNLSSIFKFVGAKTNEISYLWLAPPLTGLFLQPIIGQLSDDTVTRFGKRRPYIFVWGICSALIFCCMPFLHSVFYAVFFTLLIDASLNSMTETVRALATDLTQKAERAKAFALLSFSGGIGAALGTCLPYILSKLVIVKKVVYHAGGLPFYLQFSFFLTGIIIGVIVCLSVPLLKERNFKHELLKKKKKIKNTWNKIKRPFYDLCFSIKKTSPLFKSYCYAHALTWAGIFIFWLYFTSTISQNIYHLNSQIKTNLDILQQSNLDTSFYFSIYQYTGIIFALFLFMFSTKIRPKLVHSIALVIGSLGMIYIPFATNYYHFLIIMISIGIMWGSVCILPYSIISEILPKGKLGVYLGIFNISVTLPQIIFSLILSPIYTYIFNEKAGYLIFLGGIFILLSAFAWLKDEYFNKKIPDPLLIET